jgi:hypothetical protein
MKKALVAIEVVCFLGAAFLGVLWFRDPTGSYEPLAFLALLVGTACVDLIRRDPDSQRRRIIVLGVGVAAVVAVAFLVSIGRSSKQSVETRGGVESPGGAAVPPSQTQFPIDPLVLWEQLEALPLGARGPFRQQHVGLRLRTNARLADVHYEDDGQLRIVAHDLRDERSLPVWFFHLSVSRRRYPRLLQATGNARMTLEGTIEEIGGHTITLKDAVILDLTDR